MNIERRLIRQSLLKKGFVERQGDHIFLHHMLNGKVTGPYTKLSMGNTYKDYGDRLLKCVRQQLKLDSMAEMRDLCTCPMDGEQYVLLLRQKGHI